MIKAKKIIEIINKNKVVQAANADINEQAKVLNQKIAFEEDLKSPILVKIENLSKEFKIKNKVKTVLSNINLTIRQNDKIALLGLNGAGKTTFLEIISGVQSKTSGYISYGYDYNETPYEKIGIQFQISHYPHGLTVKDLIIFLSHINKKIQIKKDDVEQAIDMFGLRPLLNKEANSLSGGQKQRLNILLALINKPKLLLLDELTTGLDVNSQRTVISYLDKFLKKSKIPFMCVSHNIIEIEGLCNRLVLLKNGEIFCDADINKVKKEFGSVEQFLIKYIK